MLNLFEVYSYIHNYKIFYSYEEPFKIMLYDGFVYELSITFNSNNGNVSQTPTRMAWLRASVSYSCSCELEGFRGSWMEVWYISLSDLLVSPSRAAAPFIQLIIPVPNLCLLVENTHIFPIEKTEFTLKKRRGAGIHFYCDEIMNSWGLARFLAYVQGAYLIPAFVEWMNKESIRNNLLLIIFC